MNPHPQSLINNSLACLIPCIALMPLTSQAATVAWRTPTAITNSSTTLDEAFTLSGFTAQTLAQAVNFNTAQASIATTGGQTITFTAGGNAAGAGTGMLSSGYETNAGLYTGDTGSAAFNNVLDSQAFNNGGTSTTVYERLQIGGLTSGTTYILTLFASDQRATSSARTQSFSTDVGGTVNASASFSTFTNATSVIGTFVADGATQLIYVNDTATAQGIARNGTLAGFTLYSAVPEPSAAMLGALGALCLLRRRRK